MVWTGFTVALVLCAFAIGVLFGIGIMGWGFRAICQKNGEVTINGIRYLIIPEKLFKEVVEEQMQKFLRRKLIEAKVERKPVNDQPRR